MGRAEFVKYYAADRKLDRDPENGIIMKPNAGHPGYIALQCRCGEPECRGWANVRNDPESIADHKELYGK